jgi:hypothetical protein
LSLDTSIVHDYVEFCGKKAAAAAKKNSRYALQEHMCALGIELQKSDTAFLPQHSSKEDARAGIKERESAMSSVKISIKEAI